MSDKEKEAKASKEVDELDDKDILSSLEAESKEFDKVRLHICIIPNDV